MEGWIRDHSVEFLVDSGSSVTAMSSSFYQTLIQVDAPLGVLGPTMRTLRSANGTRIGISGCSHYVVSFLGLQVEFRSSFVTIIGNDVLGSVLPHTLDIKNGLLFTEGVRLSNYTDETQLCPVVYLQCVTARFHHILKLCYIVLSGLPVVVGCHPVDY